MSRKFSAVLCGLVLSAICLAAEEPSDRYYQAIRNNDLTALRELVKTSGVNVKDKHDSTPLMFAAAFGSIDAMKLLIGAGADVNAHNTFDVTALLWCAGDPAKVRLLVEKGADVNAKSKQGRTPLIVAAAHDGNSQIVKLLIDKGADVKAADANKTTALFVAAEANDTATARLLIEKGADVNAKDAYGDTPVFAAAGHGNPEVVRLLLAKGADVNVVDEVEAGRVKNGLIALGNGTALHYAATTGGAGAVKLLIDAGAKVDAQDVRGITPLVLAIATDRPDIGVIKLLLAKGADKNLKSKIGETPVDWAKKFNNPAVLSLLGVQANEVASIAVPASDSKLASPREAAAKSLALVQKSSGGFFQEGGCVSCHAQNLTAMAQVTARAQGIPVDERSEASQLKAVRLQWGAFAEVLLQRMDPPGAVDTIMYSLLHLEVENAPPDQVIDSLIHNVAGQQRKDGSWSLMGVPRPPIEDGDFSRTALSLRALAHYTIPARKTEFDQRIQKAAAWLKAAKPVSTEDRNMQLLGLKWANADRASLEKPLKALVALQRADGGWSQTPYLASDAYGTATVLYTMHELGVPASDPAYRRGVNYLLRTQLADGSWHVASRAPKFQPYFQSGFPHDHDQWISSAATAWAVIALTYAGSVGGETALK